MKPRIRIAISLATLCVLVWFAVLTAPSRAVSAKQINQQKPGDTVGRFATINATTTRVTVGLDGQQANGISRFPTISADGRYVAFQSEASNLVPDDTNHSVDIFVHDRLLRRITRVSVSSTGQQANNDSFEPTISDDGRYVAFMSDATNLVAFDLNNGRDVFVYDQATSQTTRVSVSSLGVAANYGSNAPRISPDGRFVAFASYATNLVPGDTNNLADVFVHDRYELMTTRISVSSSGQQADYPSAAGKLLANGFEVFFISRATNLVPDDTNNVQDGFIHNMQTGQTTRVSVNAEGQQANGQSDHGSISADGRFVMYSSNADNLVSDDTNGKKDVFVLDRESGEIERVSVNSAGDQANGESIGRSLSQDGRYIGFDSLATNLVDGDTNGYEDSFVHDRDTGQTFLVSMSSEGQLANNDSSSTRVLSDGLLAVFSSEASNLVDADSNNLEDIFVHDQGHVSFWSSECNEATALQPVLLVPGWGAANWWSGDAMGLWQLKEPLEDLGYREGCNLFYAGRTSAEESLTTNAIILKDTLCEAQQTIRKQIPGWDGSFDIIAHSYGGLRSRAYLENPYLYGATCVSDARQSLGFAPKVRNLFTLGTPHGGGDLYLMGAQALGVKHILDEHSQSTWELMPWKMDEYNSQHSQPDGVIYHLVGGNMLVQPIPTTVLLTIFGPTYSFMVPNDIGVSQSNATLLTMPFYASRYPQVLAHFTPDLHGHLLNGPPELLTFRSYVRGAEWATFEEEMQPHLSANQHLPTSNSAVQLHATVEVPAALPVISLASGTIGKGETHTGVFDTFDSGGSNIYLKWTRGELDFTLIDPTGTAITPESAEADSNVDYSELEILSKTAIYVFTDIEPGTWTYTIVGTDVTQGTPYQLVQLPELPVSIAVDVVPWAKLGESITINANIGYDGNTPLTGAVATAEIVRPDNTSLLLGLYDDGLHDDGIDGDGVYGNSFSDTVLGGIYGVLVEANGMYGSEAYRRTSETMFTIGSGAALLSDSYIDAPVDGDVDGRYEGLEVTVGIDVTEAGDYMLSADLETTSGEYIDHSLVQSTLATGSQETTLYFDGSSILLSGVNGPYSITNLRLIDISHDELLVDKADSTYATAAYDYRSFDAFPHDCVSETGISAIVILPEDVLFSGFYQPVAGDQFALFNANEDLCVGKGVWTGADLTITVWGDDPSTSEVDGLVDGEPIRYRYWQEATGDERTGLVANYREGNGLFAAGSSHSVELLALAEQVIQLDAGWNMVGSGISPGIPRVVEVLSEVQSDVVLVKNGAGEVYWPEYGIDTIINWDLTEGYQVYMEKAAALAINGTDIDEAGLEIYLPEGWSIVSYLSDTAKPISEMLDALGDSLVIVKDNDGNVYWPDYGVNQIVIMEPGQAYQIYLPRPDVLVYPTGS